MKLIDAGVAGAETGQRYGTRWGRAGVFAVAGLAAAAGVTSAIFNGAFGSAYISTSSQGDLKVVGLSTDQVGAITRLVPIKDANGNISTRGVATFMIGTATASGVCLAKQTSLLGQPMTLVLHAGGPNGIAVQGLTLNAMQAAGFLQATGNTEVNKNAMDISIPGSPEVTDRKPDAFGLEAQGLILRNVAATVQDARLVNVPGGLSLDARMVVGHVSC